MHLASAVLSQGPPRSCLSVLSALALSWAHATDFPVLIHTEDKGAQNGQTQDVGQFERKTPTIFRGKCYLKAAQEISTSVFLIN